MEKGYPLLDRTATEPQGQALSGQTGAHQPPDLEGMLAIYLPYTPRGQIVDYDLNRNLAANPYQAGELVRFPYGVYECKRITNFSPQEYAPDWIKRDDLT